ncbi:MAG TPA: Gfo/Idh/MocA family oxidoreductase [Rubrobacter sp.]|nr:Gfo/Idh/MocA family oxidoreductase [Rubrobacter sp.]
MNIGLLGAGRIGAFHARTLAEHPDVDVLLIGDVDAARAATVAEEVGGQHATVEGVIGAGLDAAVIAAATTEHAALIGSCLDAGLPVFCEKPIAIDREETVAVVDRVEASESVLQMGFQRRFDAGYKEAKRLIDDHTIGTLYSLRLATHDPSPPHEGYIPQSGGIFKDLFIHDLDILRWLTGTEAEEVYAQGSVREFDVFEKYDDVDTAAALIRMADGVVAVLTGGRQDPWGYDVRTEIFGSGDSVSVGLDSRTPLRSVEPGALPWEGQPYPDFLARFADAYRAELGHFLEVVQGRAENPCTARDALEALRTAVAADLSMREGRPVKLSEVG